MPTTRVAAIAGAAATVLALGACGGSGGESLDSRTNATGYRTAPGVERCSVDDLKARVDFDMRDYYVFASRVPDRSPADFATPDEQIRALRVEPDTFSRVADRADFEAQTAGRNVGFGFQLVSDADGAARFRIVVGGSPAAAAGLMRGDVLEAVDGRPVDGAEPRDIVAPLGEVAEGETVRFAVRRDGQSLDIDVVKAEYVTDTVAGVRTFDADDGTRVAYLPVSQFSDSTAPALDATFERLAADGVEALVLDVRYNPGGLIFAANRLAGHVAGANVAGGAFVQYLFNERYARELNFAVPFEDVGTATLGLDRVVVIATVESASSSELLINGLRPFVDVRVVGTTTFGKAFGSSPRAYCDVVINAMEFVTANAEGVTVADGIRPDCTVEDAWDAPLGDPADPLSGAAYRVLLDGTCPSDVQAGASPRTASERKAVAALWDDVPRVPAALDAF